MNKLNAYYLLTVIDDEEFNNKIVLADSEEKALNKYKTYVFEIEDYIEINMYVEAEHLYIVEDEPMIQMFMITLSLPDNQYDEFYIIGNDIENVFKHYRKAFNELYDISYIKAVDVFKYDII